MKATASLAGIRYAIAAILACGALTSCGSKVSQEEEVPASDPLRLGVERTIPVRFIHLLSVDTNPSVLSNTRARAAINKANEVFVKARIQFEFAGIQGIPVSHIFATRDKETLNRSQVMDLTSALGIPADWCATCKVSTQKWLEYITTDHLGTDELITWVAAWPGNEAPGFQNAPARVRMGVGSIGSTGDPYKFAHEVGHSLGLFHTHDMGASCRYWDLVYYAQPDGTHRFFTGRSDCDTFMSGVSDVESVYLERIDPRDGREPKNACLWWPNIRVPAGSETKLTDEETNDPYTGPAQPNVLAATRTFTSEDDCRTFFDTDWNPDPEIRSRYQGSSLEGNVATRSYGSDGTMTIRLPCRGCATPLVYSTGDARIVGYARKVGSPGRNAANVMGYNTQFPTSLPMMISDSQAERVIEVLRSTVHRSGPRTLLGTQLVTNPTQMIDFDGDNRRDIVTWQPPTDDCSTTNCPKGTFRILRSSQSFSTSTAAVYSFGILGDIPVLADYDGDGLTDLAVFRPGELREAASSLPDDRAYWIYCPSSLNYDCNRSVSKQFGFRGDVPVPGTNFRGTWADGEAALFRPSTGGWYHGAMCKPSGTGKTTCSTTWNGPWRLGDANSYLMPDLYDADERTDFAIYDPVNATFKLRRSEDDYGTTTTLQLDDSYRGEEGASIALPQYRRLWDGTKYLPRRTFALFNYAKKEWLTSWYWWNAGGGLQGCVRDVESPLVIGGLDIDDDLSSDELLLFQGGNRSQAIRGYSAGANSCSNSLLLAPSWNDSFGGTRSASAVADMSGDGRPDLMVIDPHLGQIRILTFTTTGGTSFYLTRSYSGPDAQVL